MTSSTTTLYSGVAALIFEGAGKILVHGDTQIFIGATDAVTNADGFSISANNSPQFLELREPAQIWAYAVYGGDPGSKKARVLHWY